MIHRSITVASIPPVMTTVPAVIRPALHQTLTGSEIIKKKLLKVLKFHQIKTKQSGLIHYMYKTYH